MSLPRRIDGRLTKGAMVGSDFEATLDPPLDLTDATVNGLDGTGLSFDPTTGTFTGKPDSPGLIDLTMTGRHNGEAVEIALRLPVSPDPWSLWKDLPVDPSLPFQKPDQFHDRIDGELLMLAASQRGRSHAHKGLPRDDHALIHVHEESGWHIGIVADGAGSAKLSREGSRIAAETVRKLLPDLLKTEVDPALVSGNTETALQASLTVSAEQAAVAIADAAADGGYEAREFSTTLIIGIARRVPEGWFLASFTIGDGLIGILGSNAPLLMSPDSGAYAGQTRFLTPEVFADPNISDRIHHRIVPEMTAFLMMTDGVSDPMFASDEAMEDPAAWDQFWATHLSPLDLTGENPKAAEILLDWLSFKQKGEHDDRSIVAMIP